jgi:hypothetical protein
MKPRFYLPLLICFLTLSPAALASTKWYVDGVNGSDNNDCRTRQHACQTIGHAISLASSGDTIRVAAATYPENLTISFSLRIVGSSSSTTMIDGGGIATVVRISNANAHVALSKLTIQHGGGSGISNPGTLTISHSTISNNRTLNVGGGIVNVGTLTINNSFIGQNEATGFCRGGRCYGGFGGGIHNAANLTINNSTLSGNGARTYGGGINNGGAATLQNSVVANSTEGGNCSGTMTSNGYNLSSDGTCNFNGPGDLNNTDPKLGQLGNYGGPTLTIPLLSGSPAIDAGNPSGCTDGLGHLLKTDQRGKPRPDKEDHRIGCDMGAYERQSD